MSKFNFQRSFQQLLSRDKPENDALKTPNTTFDDMSERHVNNEMDDKPSPSNANRTWKRRVDLIPLL